MVDLVPGTKIIYTPSGFMENLEFIQPQPEGNTQIFYLKKQEIINITPISETIESQVDGTILGVPEPVTVQTTRIQADLKIYKNYARWIPINSIWGGGFGSVFFAWFFVLARVFPLLQAIPALPRPFRASTLDMLYNFYTIH